LEPEHVVGHDAVHFNVPAGIGYTVVLWKEKYNYQEGPDPHNPWGREIGYYMVGELDRKSGRNLRR